MEDSGRLRLGILGAGMIATASYGILPGLSKLGDVVRLAAVADNDLDRAAQVAQQFGFDAAFGSLAEMLNSCALDAVVNLTPIPQHFETSRAILLAGKHLVTEKPLAASLAEADELIALAKERSLLIVSAPADMLEPRWKEAQRLLRSGAIGRPTFARVQSSHGGPALLNWPSDPSWFYRRGAGPLFDMGVYGLHRITGLLGPAQRVTAFGGVTRPTRQVRGGPFDGRAIPVDEDDNVLLLLDFGDAVFASVDATYNVVASRSPAVELYGSEGTILVNGPDSPRAIDLFRMDAAPGVPGWIESVKVGFPLPPDPSTTLQRGVMVAHLVDCLNSGRSPVLSAEHARHVLDIMLAARVSADTGQAVPLSTRFDVSTWNGGVV